MIPRKEKAVCTMLMDTNTQENFPMTKNMEKDRPLSQMVIFLKEFSKRVKAEHQVR